MVRKNSIDCHNTFRLTPPFLMILYNHSSIKSITQEKLWHDPQINFLFIPPQTSRAAQPLDKYPTRNCYIRHISLIQMILLIFEEIMLSCLRFHLDKQHFLQPIETQGGELLGCILCIQKELLMVH